MTKRTKYRLVKWPSPILGVRYSFYDGKNRYDGRTKEEAIKNYETEIQKVN